MAVDNYDFNQVEKSVLKFWSNEKIYEKSKAKNKDGKKYYWLQGPPYTSGALHSGHAWNHALKDMNLRFQRMKGFDVWDRNGYDTHGLPTEHKVMKKYELTTKEDIEKFGVEKFAEECLKFCKEKASIMTQDLQRFGVWMTYEDPYMPINKDFMESEWWLVKQAHLKKRLYEGKRTYAWCYECETACAKHELEYESVKDKSVFVKFKIKDKTNEYLIVWTTTPWTLPLNEAAMVNPEVDYVKIKVDNAHWIMAKVLVEKFLVEKLEKSYKIVEEFKGKKLEGLKYEPLFYKEMKKYCDQLMKESSKAFTVVLSKEYVDTTTGTGIVHVAGGCGPEDYEVCYDNKIPPLNPLSERGYYPKDCGRFGGLHAKNNNEHFIAALEEQRDLIFTENYVHDYAHCWRCNKPIIYRLTDQWFFKIEDLKEQMLELNKNVHWVPETAKNSFNSWLANLRDNSISKQRFWGTPLPVWRCGGCKDYVVVENAAELSKLGAKKVPNDLHKPWIDEVTLPCKCGKEKRRVPDVLDVWVDAGTVSWNCLRYPERVDLFEKYFPIDFIVEGKDQIRGWFNLLFISSMIAFGKVPYKNVYMHGYLTDVGGVKMSKSLGNVISPYEIVDKFGADTMRYYFSGTPAGEDLNFSWDEIKQKHKNLIILWNLHKFLIDFANQNNMNPKLLGTVEEENYGIEEKYIISKLNSTIKEVTELHENYNLDRIPEKIEELYFELSRIYIQLVREKSSTGSDEEKENVCHCLFVVLTEALKLFSTICPFITETIYQNLKDAFNLNEESIHLFDWPSYDNKQINLKLETAMKMSESVITSALAGREKAQIGRRWPLKEIVIVSHDKNVINELKIMEDVLKSQINVKSIKFTETFSKVKEAYKPDFGKLGPVFADKTKQVVEVLGKAKDIVSTIQKKGKYKFELNGKKHSVSKEHFIIKREVEEPYVEAEFKGGFVYLNKERNPELDAEGFVRELMRNIQDSRKKHNLEKTDKIDLFITTDMADVLNKFSREVMDKTGAKSLEMRKAGPGSEYEHSSEFKIKEKVFKIWFNKI